LVTDPLECPERPLASIEDDHLGGCSSLLAALECPNAFAVGDRDHAAK
jgi:hypothetical protein